MRTVMILIGILAGITIAHSQVTQQQLDLLQGSIAQNSSQLNQDLYQINQDEADIAIRNADAQLMEQYIIQSQSFINALSSQVNQVDQYNGVNWTSNSIN